MRRFILSTPEIAANAARFVKGFPDNGPIQQVTVEEYDPDKTDSQRAMFHVWINEWARETGYTPKEMKLIVKDACLGYEEVKKKDGTVIRSLISTESLSKKGYNELIERAFAWAADNGLPVLR